MHTFSVPKNDDRLEHTGVHVYELLALHVQEYACLFIALDSIILSLEALLCRKEEFCKQLY